MCLKNKFIRMSFSFLGPNHSVRRNIKQFRRIRKCRRRNMEAGASRFMPDESTIANLNVSRPIAFTISRAYINFPSRLCASYAILRN